ncbi:MAG: condensation domain-containing protein, partial [Acidobacteria bacterium]|nr:condensation domain-containing protein [Acidobacteriota bacterium]
LWFLDQLEPGSAAYTIPAALRLEGRLDVDALRRALGEVVRRHESLRTSFAVVDGQPAQLIAEARRVEFPSADLRHLAESEREAEVAREVGEAAQGGFDLRRGPLLRPRLLRLEEDVHVLLLTMHHIISDGWSVGVLVREVTTLYSAFSAGRPSPLPEPELQYADYAAWQREWLRGEVLAAQLSYWRGQLGGVPAELELPTARGREAEPSRRGRRQGFRVGLEVTRGLRELGEREGATLYMTLLAAFQTLLHHYSGQEDVVVGTAIANRTRPEFEGLIGFFVNTLALRVDVGGDPRFVDLLARAREACLGAYEHQDVPFEKLVEELQPERGASGQPFFRVVFALHNAPVPALELPGLKIEALEVGTAAAKFDLMLNMQDTEEGLVGLFEYKVDLFEDETVSRMVSHFQSLLGSIVARPSAPLSELELLSAEESSLLQTNIEIEKLEMSFSF